METPVGPRRNRGASEERRRFRVRLAGSLFARGLTLIIASLLIFQATAQQPASVRAADPPAAAPASANPEPTPTPGRLAPALAAPGSTTIVPYQATGYRYKQVAFGAGAGFEAPTFDDSSWSTGAAAFGSGGFCGLQSTVATHWDVNTDILVRRHLSLPAGSGALSVGIAIDNDVSVYWNGTLVGSNNHENCATQDSFTYQVPDNLLVAGDNVLAVRGRDRGNQSLLDITVRAALPPSPPTADAGPDQTVNEGAVATLDGSASSDPDSPNLTYAWALASHVGPPITLSSSTTSKPTFQTADDASYTFTLTVSDGTRTDTDQVVVTVRNVAPVLASQADPAYAGGTALVTTSFTDAGILDTHDGTLLWGDGSAAEPIPVTAQGTGWGTLVASHVYRNPGSYTVTITITDDDGGTASTTVAALQVVVAVALWANSSSSASVMETTGGTVTVAGLTHTNGDLRIRRGGMSFTGPTEYVRSLDIGGNGATFVPPAVQTASKPFPITFPIADYRPSGRAAIDAGPAYHDMSASCATDGFWHGAGATLASGIYYATCGVELNGGPPAGDAITVAAEGEIHVSGSFASFVPYVDGLIFDSASNTPNAIRIDAGGSTFLGYSFAERGRVVLRGARDTFFCGILADEIAFAAQNLSVKGASCSPPVRTIAPPTLVPTLSVDLGVNRADVLPGDPLRHTATVTNNGATLVVPGVIGIENLGAAQVTVTSHTLGLEYQAAGGGAWLPLPGTVTTTVRPNATTGVVYPAGPELVDGTVVQPGAIASWGYAMVVQLTAAQVGFLLDRAQVKAVRNVSTFGISPAAVPVRPLFHFGEDFIGQLRAHGADLTNVVVTIVPPAGDAVAFTSATVPALGALSPGESVAVFLDSTAPAPVARASNEPSAAYLARLASFDGTLLVGTAFARGLAGIGPVLALTDLATSTRHLPVVALNKTGPAAIEPATTAQYTLGLHNTGSAEARQIAVTDEITGVGGRPVSGAPTTLVAGASATATASYPVPANASGGLLNTGTVRWSDASGNVYGPVDDALLTTVIAPRQLAVTKFDVSPGSPGGEPTINYEIEVTNLGDEPVTGVVLTDSPDPLTTLIVGSVTTTAGTVTTGNTPGDTSVAVSIGTLAGRATETVALDVTVGSIPEGVNFVANQALVTSVELPPILSDSPLQPGATDPTLTPVAPGGGGGGGGGGGTGPTIGAPSPADGSVVTEPVTISATITPPAGQSVASWRITASRAGTTGETTLATGSLAATTAGATSATVSFGGIDQPVTASASFDPTKLLNGIYVITIRSTASGGGTSTATSSLIVDGNLKLGQYVTTYQDLSVGVAGLPMQVLRTYDSFDEAVGDFGVGWHVQLANFRVSVNKPLGKGGWIQETFNCGLIFCQTRYHSTTPHTVSVVWPDGHQEIFDLTPANGSTFFASATAAVFTGRARATSKLAADGDSSLSFFGDGNLYGGGFGSGGIYDPQRFRLTAKNGTVYLLDRTSGLVSATDRNGNTLTVTANGITSSRGPSITFERDPQGRITKVTGPQTETLLYGYDAAGDLKTFTDPNGRTLTYEYDGSHNLLVTDDPLNRPFQILTYVDGRLATVTDALGNEVAVNFDPDARTETVTDAVGRLTTISTLDPRGNVLEQKDIYDGKTAITTFTYDSFDNVTTRTDPNGHTWTGVYDQQNLRFFTDPTGRTTEVRYDPFGYPTRWIQPRGGETVYAWNGAGQLESITDALNDAETYTYDSAGNRESRTDREDHTWHYTYFPSGLLKTMTDPLTHTTSYTYDDSGRLLTETDPTSRVTAYTYWADGSLKTRTAPGGLVTSYTYDELGLLKTWTDEAGKTTTWQYDPAGRVQKLIDPLSHETSFGFDRDGRLETVLAPDGGVTRNTYDGMGRLASVTDPVNRVTGYSYDLAGRFIASENAAGGVTAYEYDDAGRQLIVRDPLGHQTTRTYDDDGNVATVVDPLSHTTGFAFDLADRLFRITDAASGTTLLGHNGNGQMTTRTNPENETTTSAYDPAGRLASVTDALGHSTTYGYDDAGRPTTTTDPLSHTMTNVYDPAGRVATSTTASGVATTYTYDPRGMVATVGNVLGETTRSTYDDAGHLATMRDPRGFTTTYGYDPVGRLASIEDPKTALVTFGYDLAGQQTSIRDPRGKTWRATFDLLGGIKTTADPLDRGTVRTYNDAGQLVQATDARGIAVGYAYDDAGNLQRVTSAPVLSITYTYDALNRRTTSGPTTLTYDGASRITSVAAPAGTVGYSYDDAGRRSTMTLPSGTVTYGYQDDNRLASLSGASGAFTFSYLADGRAQTVVRPNGVATTDDYDAAGRLTSITHTQGAATLAAFTYTLDASGNRTSLTSEAGTEGYTINELNQLTKVTLPGGADAIDYTYDPAGNRATLTAAGTTTTYAYDDASQLTAVGGAAYTYDEAGNRLTGGGSTYSWDALGRLASATAGGSTTTYTSDGDGRRVAAETGGTTTPYVWDTVAPFDELVSDGSTTYLHAEGLLLSEQSAGSIIYPLADALGSVRTITDASGAVTGTAGYDAFGATTAQAGATSIFGFSGEMRDASGIYLRARTLDPTTGAFLSTDPLRPGAAGVVGYNQYSYVGNNPTTLTDPSGRQAFFERVETYQVTAAAAALLACYYWCSPTLRGIAGAINALAEALREALPRPGWDDGTDDWPPNVRPFPRPYPRPYPLPNPQPPTDENNDPVPGPPDVVPVPEPPPLPNPQPRPVPFPEPDIPVKPDEPDKCGNQGPGSVNYAPRRAGDFAVGAWAELVFIRLGTGTRATVTPPGWLPLKQMDRGHLLAKNLGGSGSTLDNIVALYENPNRGAMRDFERRVALEVAACDVVEYASIPNYGGGSLPVSSVSVTAVGNGFSAFGTFTNEQP